MMKRIAISLIVLAALATPAAQADHQRYNPNSFTHWNLNNLIQSTQTKIDRGRQDGSLNQREVQRLQSRLNEIRSLRRELQRNGLSQSEYRRLDNQLDELCSAIYRERHDNNYLGSSPWDWARRGDWNRNDWNRGDRNRNDWNRGSINTRSTSNFNRPYGSGLDAKERAQAQQKMMQINQQAAKMQANDGFIDPNEQRKLIKRQQQLQKKIAKDRND